MARRKNRSTHSKKRKLPKSLKSVAVPLLGYSGPVIAIIIVVLIITQSLDISHLSLPDLEPIIKIVAAFYAGLGGLLGILAGLIKISNYLEDKPKISVIINYDDSSRIVQPNSNDRHEPRGTSFRVNLNIYADSNKPVSIRQMFLSETVGSTKNTWNPGIGGLRWGAVNIDGHHSEDLILYFCSDNVSKPTNLELIIIYAENKEKRIKLDLEKLDKT
jgi:hypothetical protein